MQTQGAALESAVSMDKAEGLDPLVQGEQSGDSGAWCEAACVRTGLSAFRMFVYFISSCASASAANPRARTGLPPFAT